MNQVIFKFFFNYLLYYGKKFSGLLKANTIDHNYFRNISNLMFYAGFRGFKSNLTLLRNNIRTQIAVVSYEFNSIFLCSTKQNQQTIM